MEDVSSCWEGAAVSTLLGKPPGAGASICKQHSYEVCGEQKQQETLHTTRHQVIHTLSHYLADILTSCTTDLHDAVGGDAEHTRTVKTQREQCHLQHPHVIQFWLQHVQQLQQPLAHAHSQALHQQGKRVHTCCSISTAPGLGQSSPAMTALLAQPAMRPVGSCGNTSSQTC